MSELIIRPFQLGDESGICDAHIASIKELCSKDYPSKAIEIWSNRGPDKYLDSIERYGEKFWVAEIDNEIIGFAGWVQNCMRGFYMHPKVTRKGYGRKLFQAAEQDMLKNSDTEYCEITSTITAKPFYEAMGFKVIEPSKHTLNDGATTLDVWKMRKDYS